MQRQTLSAELEQWIETTRADHRGRADAGEDNEFDPKHRRNREHVLGPLCRVKEGDDVMHNGAVIRVICPARDEAWFYGLQEAPWGPQDVPYESKYITDRAPADPNEEPLPVFEEEDEEEEPG